MNAVPPITLDQVPAEWIAAVRAVALRDGHAVRAGAEATIEVQSINTGEFGRLMLPGRGFHFATEAERDVVLRQIHSATVEPSPPAQSTTFPVT